MSALSTVLMEPEGWVEEIGDSPDQPHKLGMKSKGKDFTKGVDEPWAKEVIFPAGFENIAHFHSAPQFQIVLEGAVSFPTHELTAPAVHYADAFSPYGPFVVGEGFKIMVIRPWRAKKYNMKDRSTRGLRNPYGRNMYAQSREFFGQSDEGAWTRSDEQFDTQQLMGSSTSDVLDGPVAELARLDPGGSLTNNAVLTAYGLFVIVLAGEVTIQERSLEPYSMYFSRGVPGEPMVAGGKGATLLRLAFDAVADLSQKRAV